MNKKEQELREQLEDKLYYNLYNPKDGVAQTNVNVSAYMIFKQRKIYQKMMKLKNLISLKLLELLANCGGLHWSHHKQINLTN